MKTHVASCVLTAALLCACGDDDSGGTNQNHHTGGLSVVEYCAGKAALEQAWCDYIDQCCTLADQSSSVWMFMPHCEYGPEDVQLCMQDINDRIAQGLIVYDGTQAQACLDGQAAFIAAPPSTCVGLAYDETDHAERFYQSSTQIPACRATFVGQTAEGEECTGASQCVGGTSCFGTGGFYTCQPLRTEYGSCTGHHQCEPGLMCLGDFCTTPGDRFSPCEYNFECASGLICRDNLSCDYPIAAGGFCDSSHPLDCEPGYLCGYTSNTCDPALPSGMSCIAYAECLGTCEGGYCTDVCGGTWR